MTDNKQIKQILHWETAISTIGIVLVNVICQWCRVEFINQGTNLFPLAEKYALVPIVLAVLEVFGIIIWIRFSSSENDMSLEGVYLWSVFQIQWTFLFAFNHWSDLSLLPEYTSHCGPLIALIFYRICNRKFPTVIEICGCILLSVGSMFLFENILQEIKTPILAFLLSFSLMGRNECLEQLRVSGVELTFQMKNICSGLAVVMFISFILGFLINRHLLSFFVIGISSVLTSSMFTYLTWKAISRNVSVLHISMLCSIGDLISNYYVFYHAGQENGTINIYGAAVYVLGIYFLSRGSDDKLDFDKDRQSETYLRMEFLLFICNIVGIFSFFLKPRISIRDKQTVGYIGLSNFVRWLKHSFSHQ